MRLLTSQCFFLTLMTASLICSIIFQYLYPLFFIFLFLFHLLFLILLALRHNLATIFKGSLCYKMIVSQNMSSEGFRKATFLIIPRFTKSVTSWWGLVQGIACIFQYQTWPIDRYKQEQSFHKFIGQFGGLGLSSRPFSI